jgi:ABC-2 type transport system permease protein
MNMVFSLVKKDFLLIRKALLLILLLTIVYPIVYVLEFEPKDAAESIGPVLFGRVASLCTFLVYNAISIEELRHRALCLLAATPFGRKRIVAGKYLTMLVTFIMVVGTYVAGSLALPFGVPRVRWNVASIVFLGTSAFLGVYLPASFKFGYAKLQSIGIPLMLALLLFVGKFEESIISGIGRVRFLKALSVTQFGAAALVLAVLIGMVSVMISISIFERKDL